MIASMAEETIEEKLLRYETVLDLQIREIDRLRAENERLRSEGGAHAALKSIYLDPDAPQSLRAKAAIGALPHEVPRLTPVTQIELSAGPLAELVEQRRARQNALEPPYEVLSDGHTLLLRPDNGGDSKD